MRESHLICKTATEVEYIWCYMKGLIVIQHCISEYHMLSCGVWIYQKLLAKLCLPSPPSWWWIVCLKFITLVKCAMLYLCAYISIPTKVPKTVWQSFCYKLPFNLLHLYSDVYALGCLLYEMCTLKTCVSTRIHWNIIVALILVYRIIEYINNTIFYYSTFRFK